MKNIKNAFIFLIIAVFVASLMAGGSKKKAATASLNLNNISITTETVKVIDADYQKEETQEDNNSSSDNSESGGKPNSGSSTRNTSNSGSKSSGNSNKASGGSSGGNSSSSGSSSESSSEDKKPEEPAKKNVSAKEVQAQVNAYIKSKGITLDSSMTSGNASWSGQISGMQKDLNSGWTLKTCKEYVDLEIRDLGKDTIVSMYCYYSGNDFYILYW